MTFVQLVTLCPSVAMSVHMYVLWGFIHATAVAYSKCYTDMLNCKCIVCLNAVDLFTLLVYAQRVMHSVVFVCVCVCVCVCVWLKIVFLQTYWSNVFAKRMHTARSSTLHTVCHQRCLLDLLSCTESAIPLISIHTIVPVGLRGIFETLW